MTPRSDEYAKVQWLCYSPMVCHATKGRCCWNTFDTSRYGDVAAFYLNLNDGVKK